MPATDPFTVFDGLIDVVAQHKRFLGQQYGSLTRVRRTHKGEHLTLVTEFLPCVNVCTT